MVDCCRYGAKMDVGPVNLVGYLYTTQNILHYSDGFTVRILQPTKSTLLILITNILFINYVDICRQEDRDTAIQGISQLSDERQGVSPVLSRRNDLEEGNAKA